MTISAHLILAVLLLTSAVTTVICESSIRRRVRYFRTLQITTIASALLLVPSNVIAATPGHLPATVDTFS